MQFKRILFLIILLLSAATGFAQQAHRLHALLIVDIIKNTDFPVEGTEYVIAVLGKSPVHDELKTYTQNVHMKNLNIRVVQLDDVDEISNDALPQVVFITRDMSGSFLTLLAKTRTRPMIIISEDEGLYIKGAEFSVSQHETKGFHVNVNDRALERRQVKISRTLDPIIENRI